MRYSEDEYQINIDFSIEKKTSTIERYTNEIKTNKDF